MITVTKKTTGFLQLLECNVNTKGTIECDIILKFQSTGRNSAMYYFEDEGSDSIYEEVSNYAHSNCTLHGNLLGEVKYMLNYYGISLTPLEDREILKLIRECFEKCDSTYGSGVKDFDKYEADAVIIFKGE